MYLTILTSLLISSISIGKKDAVKQFTARFLYQPIKRAIQAFFNLSPKEGFVRTFRVKKGIFRNAKRGQLFSLFIGVLH